MTQLTIAIAKGRLQAKTVDLLSRAGLGLSRETMEATTLKGLYFIGEAVDVTGHLGGFNFQWAWASARAAGQALRAL